MADGTDARKAIGRSAVVGPIVDIVIRSYYKDFRWLGYCLRSIRKYTAGFRSTIVVVPRASQGALRRHQLSADRVVVCEDYRDDYLGQQVTKLHVDELTDAEFIAHVDSDTIFVRPMAALDLFDQARPRIVMTPYNVHARNGPWRIPWQGVTEAFLRRPVAHNFMQVMPLTYPRWLYGRVREFSWRAHGRSLRSYVLSQRARGFSEFNALGAWAYDSCRDALSWLDTATDRPPKPHTRVFWSWGGISDDVERELESLLQGELHDTDAF